MKIIKHYLFFNSFRISIYFFILNLLTAVFVSLYGFHWKLIPPLLAYLFWFSTGLMVGCYWMREAVKYLNTADKKGDKKQA